METDGALRSRVYEDDDDDDDDCSIYLWLILISTKSSARWMLWFYT